MNPVTKNQGTLKADVVIVGGGAGGLSAAVAAAELGASVIVLEKRKKVGGNAIFAEGFFAAESPAQQRNNIYSSRDECFRIGMEYSHWTIDARILRTFIDKSGDTVRWLEAKGLECNWIAPLYPGQMPLVWHCFKEGGNAVVKILKKSCDELGVHLLCDTTVKKILLDKRGRAEGVLATSKNETVRVDAKNVIIGTGGYAANKEMLRKYAPLYVDGTAVAGMGNDGDGILMAWEAGADSDGMGHLQLVGPGYGAARMGAVSTEPTNVWVNKNGQRFTDESTAYNIFKSVNMLFRQPDRISYSLMDENAKENILKNGIIKGSGIIIVQPGTAYPELDADLKSAAQKGEIKIADNWDDIAAWIGCNPEVLRAEINEYNSNCDKGCDKIFAKERRFMVPLCKPPYYAMKCEMNILGTTGGIKINPRMEVISRQGKPIPGLYAIGVDTGGWESEHYCADLSGTTFGFALNSGRIAAENAVKSLR